MIGGISILTLLINGPAYMRNALRQDLWRAGHAQAGVFLVLSLVALRYVDETELGAGSKWLVRLAIPSAAILVPAAFFLSVLSPDATGPNGLIALEYIGAAVLATDSSCSASASCGGRATGADSRKALAGSCALPQHGVEAAKCRRAR
jgi:hypothetical protein